MRSFSPLISFFLLLLTFDFVSAATKEQWRGKSIYQLLTDRFAPVSDTAPARTDGIPEVCDGALQTWCGGTWRSIIDKLDYIQGMGMDAIWISPVAKNIDLQTPYHFAYHGYWVIDPHELNPRFGTEDDLHDLVTAVHARGMYIMVDIVINNIPSLAVDEALHPEQLEAVGSYWTKTEQFHPQCWIDYSNATSVEYCWLGDDKLPLMDVNTEDQEVIDTLQAYIKNFVQEYKIDGLRIDAAKHVPGHFWQGFCGAAGVFCIGEVYGSDMGFAAQYQVQNWMDSVLGYPLYYGLTAGFGTPMGNMTHFVDIANQVMTTFPDPSIIGNFIENHDLPRWRNVTVDPQLAYNAIVASFIFEGLPVVYYGQEQDISEGLGDPYNRNALWPYGYSNTSTYWHIAQLNQVRHALISNGTKFEDKTFLDYPSKIIANTNSDVAIRKGPLLAVLTNRGSPSQAATFGVKNTGWPSQSSVIDIFSCKQYIVGADQSVTVSYAESGYGGMPYVFLSSVDAQALHVCGTGITAVVTSTSNNNKNDGNSNNAAKTESHQSSASHTLAKVVDQPVGMLGVGVLILVAAGTFGSWFA